MIGRETLITVGAIAAGWALAQLIVWIRAWRVIRRERLADEQLRLEMIARRGFRKLQRRHSTPVNLR